MAARAARIRTNDPNVIELRRARRAGRRDAIAHPHATPPAIARHRADVRTVAHRTDRVEVAIARRSGDYGRRREDARLDAQRRREQQPDLIRAAMAAGSGLRVLGECTVAALVFGLCFWLDYSGGMVFMDAVRMPAGVSPNLLRPLGAFGLGLIVTFLPIWAARCLAHQPVATADERRRAALGRPQAARRAVILLALALVVVGLIALARLATPAPLASTGLASRAVDLGSLPWWALALLGIVTVVLAFNVERYLASRSGAIQAHRLLLGNRMGILRAESTRRAIERRLAQLEQQRIRMCEQEERTLRDLGQRYRRLYDAWFAGAAPFLEHPVYAPVVADEVRPAPFLEPVVTADREVAVALEARATELLRDVDPFVLVLPRRQPPVVLQSSRRMFGLPESHHA